MSQVVTCLKAMSRSLVYGDQVGSLLQASSVWSQYESQKHDLFIGKVMHLIHRSYVSFFRGQASCRIFNFSAGDSWIPDYVTVSSKVIYHTTCYKLLALTFHCMFCLKVCDAQCAAADREQRQPRQQRPPDVELWPREGNICGFV